MRCVESDGRRRYVESDGRRRRDLGDNYCLNYFIRDKNGQKPNFKQRLRFAGTTMSSRDQNAENKKRVS